MTLAYTLSSEKQNPYTLKPLYKSRRKEHPDMAKHHNLCRMVPQKIKRNISKEYAKMWRLLRYRIRPELYESIQKITGKHAPQVKSVKDEQGKILTDPTAVKVRWKEYFDKLYNDPNSVDEDCLVNFPESHNDEDISTIGEDEVEAAVKRMKLKKAAGVDNLSIEEIKAATQASELKVLHMLCKMVWGQYHLIGSVLLSYQ